MNEVALIIGMMLVTFLPRYGVMALLGRVEMPKPVFRALRFVPPAVLSAIIVPTMVFNRQGEFNLSLQNSALIAGLISIFVAWRTRNVLLTILIGMTALWLWRALVGG